MIWCSEVISCIPHKFSVPPAHVSSLVKHNTHTRPGITSVSVAAHKGREEIVKMLISAGADVNIDSNNGSTPLIQASHFGECLRTSCTCMVQLALSAFEREIHL